MIVVVGLGNPGRQYADTPHNAGFRVVDAVARRTGAAWHESRRFSARTVKTELDGCRILLVQPLTFMNASGVAVGAILRCNGAAPSDGSDAFTRVRVGIGRDPGREDLVGHVLRPVSGAARELFDGTVERAAEAVCCIVREGIDAAMNRFNGTRTEREGAADSRAGDATRRTN